MALSGRSTRAAARWPSSCPPDFSQDSLDERRLGAGDPRRHRRQHRQYRARLRPGRGRGFSRNIQLERTQAWAAAAGHPAVVPVARLVQRRPGEPRFHHSRAWWRSCSHWSARNSPRYNFARVGARHDGAARLHAGHRMELMAGKILPYFFIGLLDAALCLAIAVFWFEVPFRGAVSTLFRDDLALPDRRARARLFHFGEHPQSGRREPDRTARTMLPTTLLSGFAFPIDQMPPAVQAVTYLVPPATM